MEQEKLDAILTKHEKWLDDDGGERADLSDSDLSGSDLSGSDLRYSDLKPSNLRHSNLRRSNLRRSDLRGADLRYSNLSGATGLLGQNDWMLQNLESTDDGYIAYKSFGKNYNPPEYWSIEAGSTITEVVNPYRTDMCGWGVNVATRDWESFSEFEVIWKVLIRWEWLPGVVVPYNTDGKFRVEKCELLEIVQA